MPIPAPSVEYGWLSPMLIVFGAAVAGVLVEAFAPRRRRYAAQLVLSVGALAAALAAVVVLGTRLDGSAGTLAAMGAVAIDAPALYLQGTVALLGVLGVLLVAERLPVPETAGAAAYSGGLDAFAPQAATVAGSVVEKEATRSGVMQTEVFPLLLFAVGGMMLFGATDDLLTMFIALEVLSLPLYLLCGLARRRRLISQEASLKYFLLGAFASAFFLFGIALLYAYAGTLTLRGLRDALTADPPPLALIGVALLLVGPLFKVGAVPFHSWIPDVYQGAPTPVTAFMAAATKVAAFGALLRICFVALPGVAADWRPLLWAVAIATMLVGTVTAVTQTDVKRMLAYSAVAHAGFILTGVIAANDAGLAATLFYLLAYGLSTLGSFALVGLVRDDAGREDTALARWAGLGRSYPVTGVVFSLFLLAFAGIPLTSGFVSKFAVFKAAGEGGALPLVVVGVIASAVAAYFYVRVIVLMFFTDPPADGPAVITPSPLTITAIGATAVVTFVLGALPQPLLDLVDAATPFVG
ncbi:NADH-quinone oxidoreductase subunit NuoN [Mycobacterium sp. MYCO198283]|uniref:NADH-quinone oxidoreductase subunit NuoN n=1 Tax=Mycobacterium sp. MYCO198283 TaxID=2883505 RepID=UPI001E37F0F9|nr:NADH-quinone oxidoreductase subunit NuoN [Mycobacterium sp. MYCO198283]MCG5431526.1 NADH-quinone oxidoreductase subunit NuoN [Mycobacterium sp. MYCO198283]